MSHYSNIRAVAYGALMALLYTIVLTAGHAAVSLLGPAIPRAPITELGPQRPAHAVGIIPSDGSVASDRSIALAPPPLSVTHSARRK